MKETPILFTGDMVRAILAGRKTQTRRVIKPRQSTPKVAPLDMRPWMIDGEQERDDDGCPLWIGTHPDYPTGEKWFSCDYGTPGDRLYVKETWAQLSYEGPVNVHTTDGCRRYEVVGTPEHHSTPLKFRYRATDGEHWAHQAVTWKPSIHMPKRAARIWLELTAVRVERLQDITVEDAIAEGITPVADYERDEASGRFSDVWNSINGKRGYSWDSNPFCWVLSFKRVQL